MADMMKAKGSDAFSGERGQTLVEYALLVVLIAVLVLLMLKGTGQQVNTYYSKINSGLSDASN